LVVPLHKELELLARDLLEQDNSTSLLGSYTARKFMQIIRTKAKLPALILGIGLQTLSFVTIGIAQVSVNTTTPPPPVGHGQVIPAGHLYWHFLEYQLYLDKTATAIEQKGGNGTLLRTHYQTKMNFTTSQFSLVLQAAGKLDTDLQQIDGQAKVIIDAFHKQYPPGKIASLPPAPPQLAQLQTQRETIIANDVAALKAQLGTQATSAMDSMLAKEFAPHFTFKHLSNPESGKPIATGVFAGVSK
jgi:hypothetical protein